MRNKEEPHRRALRFLNLAAVVKGRDHGLPSARGCHDERSRFAVQRARCFELLENGPLEWIGLNAKPKRRGARHQPRFAFLLRARILNGIKEPVARRGIPRIKPQEPRLIGDV